MYECLSTSMDVHMCWSMLLKVTGSIRFLGLDLLESPCGFWEPNPYPQPEQSMLLSVEPFLQLPILKF